MAVIPEDPKQRNFLFIGIALLLSIYPFYSFWYTGKRDEVNALQTRLETLEDQNRRAQVLAARGGGQLEERMALYERHVAKLEELIPAAEEVAGLVDDITQRSRTVGVDVGQLLPEPPEPSGFYTRRSYQLAVVGEYHNVARFLTEIASLPRIVTPVELQLSPSSNAGLFPDYVSPVQANFRIETYVLPEQAGGAPSGGSQ